MMIRPGPNSLIVPEAAVTYDAQKNATVEIADPGAPGGHRTVPVKLGIGNGTRTEVREGLEAGDKVVLPG